MPSPNHIALYLVLIAIEWALVLLVRRLARPHGITELVGPRWGSASDIGRDVALATAMWLAWIGLMRLIHVWFPSSTPSVVSAMLPRGVIEGALWVALSLSAGFAEELAFRGYLQRKLTRATGRVSIGILLQAVIFGVVHGYQGVVPIARIIGYGVLFGGVAHWRRSLRPGMIAHAWTDIAAGLLHW